MATAMLELSSTVHGYHVYKQSWNAMIGEVLQAEREEPRNVYDRYAVMLMKEDVGTVGHVPKKISKPCHLLLARRGEIEAIITGARHFANYLPQGGRMSHVDTYSPETEPLFKDSNMHLRK